MFDGERDIVRAYFESRTAPCNSTYHRIATEAEIEEAGIVGPQLSAGRIVSGHFGGILGRDHDAILR